MHTQLNTSFKDIMIISFFVQRSFLKFDMHVHVFRNV